MQKMCDIVACGSLVYRQIVHNNRLSLCPLRFSASLSIGLRGIGQFIADFIAGLRLTSRFIAGFIADLRLSGRFIAGFIADLRLNGRFIAGFIACFIAYQRQGKR